MGEDIPTTYETIGLRKNGDEFPFEISIGNYFYNNEKYTIAIIRDISYRKDYEKNLKAQNEEYEVLNEELRQTIDELSKSKDKIEENEQFLKLKNEEYESLNEELRQTNEDLHNANETSEERLKLIENITNNIPAFVAVVDADSLVYKFVNFKYASGFNKTIDEIIGHHIIDVIGKENTDFAMKYIEEVRNGKSSSYTNAFQLTDGKKYVSVNYVPGFNEKNQVKNIIVLSFDITDIKNSEQELLEAKEKAEASEKKYRTLVETSPDVIVLTDLSGKHLFRNSAYFTSLGYSEIDDVSLDGFSKVHPDDVEIVKKEYKKLFETGLNSGEYRVQHKNGNWIYRHTISSLIYNEKGEQIQIMNLMRDVTDRKKIEADLIKAKEKAEEGERKLFLKNEEYEAINEELRQTNDELLAAKIKAEENERKIKEQSEEIENFFSCTIDLLCIANTEGYFLRLNKEWENCLGYKIDELEGKKFIDFVHKDDLNLTLQTLSQLKNKENVINFTNRYKAKDGSYKWIDWKSYPYGNKIFAAARDITSKIIIENELLAAKLRTEENELQFRQLFENMEQAFAFHQIIYDQNNKPCDYRYILTNKAFENFTGIKGSDGKLVTELLPNLEPYWIESFGKVAQTGVSIQLENYVKELDKYYSVIAYSPKKDHFAVVFTDITNNKNYEKELISAKERAEENEARFKALHNASFGGIAIHDKGIILDCNQGLAEISGFSIDELIGMDGLLLIAEKWREMVMNNIVSGYEKPYEAFGVRKNGEEYPLRLEARNIPYQGRKVRTVEFRDLTEQKKAEEDLSNTRILLQRAFEQSPIPMVLVSMPDAVIRIVNQTCSDFLDIADEPSLVNTSLKEIKPSWQDFGLDDSAGKFEELPLAKSLNGIITVNEQRYIITKNGKVKWELVSGFPIFNNKNEILAGYLIINDITEQKRIEKELIAAKEKAEESDKLKTAFLQNLSHEIRTPMNAIIGFSDFLNNSDLSPEKRKSFTSIIINSSQQLLSIVSDILTISSLETKQEKLNIQSVCVNSIIVDLLAIFKNQASNQNILLYAKQPLNDKQSEVFSDKTKITQILTNLLTNALKFTHKGFVEFGYTFVETLHATSQQILHAMSQHELQFYVKDTGIGISQEQVENIFERFRQADLSITKKYGGTGLGLSISKGFVELLGGKIWVESELNKGATFYFTIPYFPTQLEKNQENKPVINYSSITVLVAEDETNNFLLLNEFLSKMKFEVIHAKNGLEAVEICNSNNKIGLVIMDIKMPVMNGYDAAVLIKQLHQNLPIIAQTAYAVEQEKENYNKLAFDDFVTKPINIEELKEKIIKMLSK